MKRHFYKIPMETIESMFGHAAKMDTINGYDYTNFLESWIKERHEMIVTEGSDDNQPELFEEDEIEERRRLPNVADANIMHLVARE